MFWGKLNEVYSGDWKADKQHGLGQHIWKESSFHMGDTTKQRCNRYSGEWNKGLRHGTGTFFYANGSQYHGEWKSNVKDGFGCLTFSSGAVWEGVFSNDRMPSKTDRQSEAVEAQIKLNVCDLIEGGNSTMGGGSHELRLLENTLLRFHSELKVVYRHYAQIHAHTHTVNNTHLHKHNAHTHDPDAKSYFTLTMNQLRIMLAECMVTNHTTMTFKNVGDIFYRMRRHHELQVKAAWEER